MVLSVEDRDFLPESSTRGDRDYTNFLFRIKVREFFGDKRME